MIKESISIVVEARRQGEVYAGRVKLFGISTLGATLGDVLIGLGHSLKGVEPAKHAPLREEEQRRPQEAPAESIARRGEEVLELARNEIPPFFRLILCRMENQPVWSVVTNPRWDSVIWAQSLILNNEANDFVDYRNCGMTYRMIRVVDYPKYGDGRIYPSWCLDPSKAGGAAGSDYRKPARMNIDHELTLIDSVRRIQEDEQVASRVGFDLADLLGLRRDFDEPSRWPTAWGTKTDAGLARSVLRLLIEAAQEQEEESSDGHQL